jgi:poly-gamma-glutamate synthesis protein (capsule biosynthesis protein)
MARIEGEIREARRQADVVLVSIHAHETDGEDTTAPAQFIQKFAKRCIDVGASAVIGHGPHELRGIEVYKAV